MTIAELFKEIADTLGFQTPEGAVTATAALKAQLDSGALAETTPEIRIPIIHGILDDAARQIKDVDQGSLIQLGAHVAVAQFRWDIGLLGDSYDDLFGDEGILETNPPNLSNEVVDLLHELEALMRQELEK